MTIKYCKIYATISRVTLLLNILVKHHLEFQQGWATDDLYSSNSNQQQMSKATI